MRMFQNWLLVAALGVAITSCSKSDQAPALQSDSTITAGTTESTEITWEDLMPAGEEALLETLYVEFYEDFERQMLQNSTSLADAAKQEADVSILIEEGSADDKMEQIGTFNVVESLDGKQVRIPGYVVPFDFSADAEHTEFLLVPYFGACLHTPPPPPNQIVMVKAETAAKIENIYDPVWLEGTLTTGKFLNDLGNSAYELNLSKLEPYEY